MSRTHYQIYQEQTFVLAKTLIVKHEEIASSMNDELYNRGYIVDSNPYHWRYYLNLSGEYHEADQDELYETYGTEYIMVKLPSDNGPIEVPLTKELLHGDNADKAMMNEYQIGSKFYIELVSRYPNFETLIIGILNPIEREVALTAYNGEILFVAGRYKKIQGERRWFDTIWYSVNEVLIEPQEDNLIFQLQIYINNFLKHWNNPDYVKGNDLYAVTMLGILYCNIPIAILNIRLGNCRTVKAHTFHIRQYLESHGQIGRYVDFLPIASSLWLYRNATYLEANSGKQLTFDSIMGNLLTPNEIPMSAYSIRHELSNMNDDKLLPTGMLYKEILNFEVVGASDDDRTVRDILNDQIDLARDNHLDLDDKTDRIQETINWGGDDRLNTKVLESEMLELGEPYPFTLDQFLFNLWGYTALRGYYTGTAYATNPLTGDRISFNAKNAYIAAMYCLNKAIAGVELDRIPSPTLYHIPKTNLPDNLPNNPVFKLKPTIDESMMWCVADKTRRLKVLEVTGTFIPSFYAQDSETFFNNVQDVYYERIRKYNTYCDVENVEERGDLELVAKRLYWTGFKQAVPDMSYDNWFRTVGFDPDEFNNDDLLNIGLELVASATGTATADTINRRWLQKSLLAIMRHFISYTVHVIEKFADGEVTYLEGQTLRFSNFTWDYVGGLPVKYNLSIDYNAATQVKQSVHIDISNVFESTVVDVNSTVNATLDVGGFEYGQSKHTLYAGVYALSAEVMNIEFNTEQAPPVYINIVDDIINTIVLTNTNAIVKDSSLVFTLPTSNMGLILNNVSALAVDTLIRTYGSDNSNVITTVNVNAEITDAGTGLDSRIDVTTVSNANISAAVNDNSIKIVSFVDSHAVYVNDVSGNYEDDYSGYNRYRNDIDNLNINNMNATLCDMSHNYHVVDNHDLTISDIEVDMFDPQIPTVVGPTDIHGTVIGSVHGSNNYDNIDYVTVDTQGVTIEGVTVVSEEESKTVSMSPDSNGVVINTITITSTEDNIVNPVIELGNSIVIDTIEIDRDDTNVHATVTDASYVDIIDISGTMTDRIDSTGYGNESLYIDGVSGAISDTNVSMFGVADSNAIAITSITISNIDTSNTVTVNDVNAIGLTNISLGSIDYNTALAYIDKSNAVTIDNITIGFDEESVLTSTSEDAGILVNSITMSDDNELGNITTIDNSGISTPASMLSIILNDIEVSVDYSETDMITIDNSSITMSLFEGVDDPNIIVSTSNDHKLLTTSNDVELVFVDPPLTYNLPISNHGIALLNNRITIRVMETSDEIIKREMVDSSIANIGDIEIDITEVVRVADSNDDNIVDLKHDELTIIMTDDVPKVGNIDTSAVNTNNIELLTFDESLTINVIDYDKVYVTDITGASIDIDITTQVIDTSSTVVISQSNINISINDESDDSNSNP